MSRIAIKLLLLFLFGAALAACHHSDNGAGVHFGFGGGDISYDKHTIVIRVPGQPRARITPEGQLLLDEKPAALTPAGQAAMARYYASGRGFGNQAVQVGLDSASFAMHTVGKAFEGLLHGNTGQVEKDARQGSEAIKQQARQLCQMMSDWRSAQDAAVAAAPEFKPYAVIGAHDTEHCTVDDDEPEPIKPAPAVKT
jgi:hypothetical protein